MNKIREVDPSLIEAILTEGLDLERYRYWRYQDGCNLESLEGRGDVPKSSFKKQDGNGWADWDEADFSKHAASMVIRGYATFCGPKGEPDGEANRHLCKKHHQREIRDRRPLFFNGYQIAAESAQEWLSHLEVAGARVETSYLTDANGKRPHYWTVSDPAHEGEHTDVVWISMLEQDGSVKMIVLTLPLQGILNSDRNNELQLVAILKGEGAIIGKMQFWNLTDEDALELSGAIQERNEALGLRNSFGEDAPETKKPPARNRALGLRDPFAEDARAPMRAISGRTTELSSIILHPENHVYRAAVDTFARADLMTPIGEFTRALTNKYKGMEITTGFRTNDEKFWQELCRLGHVAIKVNAALWARWYEATQGEDARAYITVELSQFCSDIGYPKATSGGHKRENKQTAMRTLEAVTGLEMQAVRSGRNGAKQRLRGSIWSRGLIGDQAAGHQFGDLFGQAGAGDPGIWEPVAFSFAPGPWFSDKEFHADCPQIGKMSAGLLKIPNKQEWALLIGGYFSTLARTNGYKPRRLRVETILQRIDKVQDKDAQRRAKQYSDKFYDAMRILVEYGVIARYSNLGESVADDGYDMADDMLAQDDPSKVAAYYAREPAKRKDWRKEVIEIHWPNLDDMARLQTKIEHRLPAPKRRRAKKA